MYFFSYGNVLVPWDDCGNGSSRFFKLIPLAFLLTCHLYIPELLHNLYEAKSTRQAPRCDGCLFCKPQKFAQPVSQETNISALRGVLLPVWVRIPQHQAANIPGLTAAREKLLSLWIGSKQLTSQEAIQMRAKFLFGHSMISKLWFIRRYKNTSFSVMSMGCITFYPLAFPCVALRTNAPSWRATFIAKYLKILFSIASDSL